MAIDQFITNEVKSNDVVLFMKGTPQTPMCGFSSQVVQILAHLGLEGIVDDLVLLDPRLAAEYFRDHGCGIMIAVAGEVLDADLGVGETLLDHPRDVFGGHSHAFNSTAAT